MIDTRSPGLDRLAAVLFEERSLRRHHFQDHPVADLAWDLLLALYLQPSMLTGRLATFTGVPLTTTLRWLDQLEEHGLIERTRKPNDRRATLVALSNTGAYLVESYLEDLHGKARAG